MVEKDNLLDSFISPDIREKMEKIDYVFPFEVTLNFKLLLDFIKKQKDTGNLIRRNFAQSILEEIEKFPELNGEIKDFSVLKKHEFLIENMMMFVFPDFSIDKQACAALIPFTDKIIFTSPKFRELFVSNGEIKYYNMNIDSFTYLFGKTIQGFGLILTRFYGMDFRFEFPIVHKITDSVTGLDLYYKMNMANEFVNLELKGELQELSDSDKEEIRSRIYDLEFLKEKIDINRFRFSGFLVLNMINISDTEILSSIKKDLIEKETITTYVGFLKLQHKLKSLLKCPGLLLGLVDIPGNSEELFHFGHKIGNSFLFNEQCKGKLKSLRNSIYEKSIKSRNVIIIEDLLKYENKTIIEEELIKQDVRNILIAPLIYGNQITGILEIGTAIPGRINLVNALKLYEVLPLFSMAVTRSKLEMSNKIQAVIKERCTAIHPSLEWRFRNAAINLLKKEAEGMQSEMEDIVFHNVYPLYGLSDIRNSSNHRNNSIRDDLVENLELAKNVILNAAKIKNLEAFDELIHRIEKKIISLKFSINSGDEADILKFIKTQVVTLFDHLTGFGENVKEAINLYNSSVDSNLGFVYKKRKNYEESASRINNMIASYLDEEQSLIQKVFPHYFERYKTDGVEHNIYMGSSLVRNMEFSKLYLKNIRLWQLITMCSIVVKSGQMEKELSVPLETAHLILVQSIPLSIRFRFDEKKFDVDGAYNVRYEILKKRIDKAEIKGKEERLTQPGKIAIVYNQFSEAGEYIEYIEYLQYKKFLNKEIEELEIEDLQGIKGLKALRVSVNMNLFEVTETISSESILKEFQSIKSK